MRKTILHIIIVLLIFCCRDTNKGIKQIQSSKHTDASVTEKNIDSVKLIIPSKSEITEAPIEISTVYVIAESGLIYRKKPNLNSEKLGKFELGSKLSVIEKTGIDLEVRDNQKTIKGEWIKVTSKRSKWHSGYVFDAFVLDSTKADFSQLPIDYAFRTMSDIKRTEVKFEKLNLSLTKINSNEFKYLTTEQASDTDKIKPLKSVGNPQAGGYFLIKTDKNIFKFPCGENYSRPCYIYENFIPSINSYSIVTLGEGMAETFLLDKGNNSTLYPVYDYDHGGFSLTVSPSKENLIVYSSINYDDYEKYYAFKSYLVMYDIKNIKNLSDIKNAYVFTTNEWQINQIKWIDSSSFIIEVFDKAQSDKHGEMDLSNIRYFRATIE